MADATMLNLDKVKAQLARLMPAAEGAAAKQLKTEAEELAAAIKRAAPVGKTGHLQESIKAEPGDGPLSEKVVAGGKLTTVTIGGRTYDRAVAIGSGDTAGRTKVEGGEHVTFDYARAVEFGRKTARGGHVGAHPFFWPTYRAQKAAIKRRMSAATKAAVKQEFPE